MSDDKYILACIKGIYARLEEIEKIVNGKEKRNADMMLDQRIRHIAADVLLDTVKSESLKGAGE